MDNTRRSMVLALAGLSIWPVRIVRAGGRAVRLNIASDGDALTFKPDRLTCPTAAAVTLTFHHTGAIIDDPHNWVLLKPGTADAFLAEADHIEDDITVVPPTAAAMVLAATPMCERHKTVTIRFTAPPPGDYPFVCSVPGHGATMRGILTVTS